MTPTPEPTPGPWRSDEFAGEASIRTEDGTLIAHAAGRTPSENIANARLIASAPSLAAQVAELRSALEAAPCTCTGNCRENPCYRNTAARALASTQEVTA